MKNGSCFNGITRINSLPSDLMQPSSDNDDPIDFQKEDEIVFDENEVDLTDITSPAKNLMFK